MALSRTKTLKTVFLGTPDFSVPSLEILCQHPNIDLRFVIAQSSKPVGRGGQITDPAVIQFAKNQKINFYQTDNINKDSEILTKLDSEEIDLIIVLAFGQFLGEKILNTPKIGCFNIHTSLLPKFRGAAPIQWALVHGEKETGVSIQKMVKKMDAGDLVISDKTPIGEQENASLLYTRLKFMAALSLNQLIELIQQNKLVYTAQDESKVSFAPIIKKEDGHLVFSDCDSKDILNKIRGFSAWPGTYCFLNQKRLKILEAEISAHHHLKAGEVNTSEGQLLVGTKSETLRLTQIQLEGKKACSDVELLNGLREKIEFR